MTFPIKKINHLQFLEENNNYRHSYKFNVTMKLQNFKEPVFFSTFSEPFFKFTNIDKNEHKGLVYHNDLKSSYLNMIEEHKKEVSFLLRKITANPTLSFLKNSILKAGKENVKRDKKIIKNLNQYMSFLENTEEVELYYKENYEQLDKPINIIDFDTGVNVGDSVYIFVGGLNLHKTDSDFNDLFQVFDFKIEKIEKTINEYGSLNENTQCFVKQNIFVEENLESSLPSKYLDFNFSSDGVKAELNQGVTNYRKFLKKDDLNKYLKELKENVNKKLEGF